MIHLIRQHRYSALERVLAATTNPLQRVAVERCHEADALAFEELAADLKPDLLAGLLWAVAWSPGAVRAHIEHSLGETA
ncbi:MAG: hypothetical protein M0R73_12495 [Dehalococcoidia bacterium]|nr:hypothetical protein [Dehalococcoidia bacterium]